MITVGAGILPYAVYEDDHVGRTIYFLLGQQHYEFHHQKIWNLFSGYSEDNELSYETCAREFFEESCAIVYINDKNETLPHIDDSIIKEKVINETTAKIVHTVDNKRYIIYLLEIPFDKELPTRFRNTIDCINKINVYHPSHLSKQRLFTEKKQLQWFSFDHLQDSVVNRNGILTINAHCIMRIDRSMLRVFNAIFETINL